MQPLRKLRNNLAFQYLSLVCTLLIVVQIGSGLFYVQNDFRNSLELLETRVESQAKFLSAVSEENVLSLNFSMLEKLMEQASEDPDILFSAIFDSDGKLLTRFLDLENSEIAAVAYYQGQSSFKTSELPNLMEAISLQPEARRVIVPIFSDGTPLGSVQITYSITNAKQRLYRSAIAIFSTTLLIDFALVVITIFLFNRKVGRPIKRLVVLAESLAAGDFEALQENSVKLRRDEVGTLMRSFYSMAIQLQDTLDGLQEKNRTLAIANAELDQATKMKSQFLANMSHELRTPLNAVLGLSQALMSSIYGPLTDKQRLSLQRISDSGKHLLSLIQDILDLAKIESGKEELNLQPVSIPQVCQTSVEIVRSLADTKDLELSINIDLEEEPIYVDERRIRQVFINLLGNAFKFTPSGGAITVSIYSSEKKDTLYFAIADTGIGITPEDMDKLFDSFVQGDSSLSRSHEGTGLGLTLVRSIVEMHSGSVSVESTLGKGSCFTVALPWRRNSQEMPKDGPTGQKVGRSPVIPQGQPNLVRSPSNNVSLTPGNHLILIAEENANNIIMLGEYLGFKGYDLAFAKDGYDAVELARKNKPSLILMDIHLPRIDGLEATKQLRAEPEMADVPIVALTALAVQGGERYYQAGFDEYVTKPVDLEELSTTIREILTQKSGSKARS